jgi:hypothetical protein
MGVARFLFALLGGCLLVIELGLAALGVDLVAEFVQAMWLRSPLQGILAVLLFAVVAAGLVRAWRRERSSAATTEVHPGPSVSRIPITGSMGAVYMLQFVIWALVIPQVTLLYAVLLGGGVLLVPVAFYFNRPHGAAPGRVGVVAGMGAMCGLLVVSAVTAREVPSAALFGAAVLSGVAGAVLLIVRRRHEGHPSIRDSEHP